VVSGVGSRLAELLLVVTALPALAAGSYLALLAVIARRRHSPAGAQRHRFDVIVPAHDEAGCIEATVESLLRVDYPRERYRVLVVADNCTDATAECAAAAGARVLIRNDDVRRGKGYALAYAYDVSLRDRFADAVVVVDADTSVSANLLTAFSARLDQGEEALQAEYGVRNPDVSWRTRLMVVAFMLFHTVRSRAREVLGLSCGLRGNGMCFRTTLLQRVPSDAFSIVEDIEYGIALGRAGQRVAYVDDACVLGDMPATASDSRSQRERWEGGRWLLARRHVVTLVRDAVSRRDPVLLDLAIDLVVPPLSLLAGTCALGALVALVAHAHGLTGPLPVVLWSLSVGGVAVYVTRGIMLAGGGWRVAAALLWAPVYALWKFTLFRRSGSRRDAWIRTRRLHDTQRVQ
jgi:cellulose synthase/poly-beta-1,6-N-acetylglucosamine synthase-like glycosyltransferase